MRIALIGAGPSSLAVFIGLSRRLPFAVRNIKIFDAAGLLNSDFLVSRNPTYLTNTSAGITSIMPASEADFVDWLAENEPQYADEKAFVPRLIYRRYVLQRFNEADLRFRRAGCESSISTTEVTAIERCERGEIEVRTSKGRDTFDIVILGIGAVANDPIPGTAVDDRYVPNIYGSQKWERQLPKNGKVLVLGSKLSAIDATVSLLTLRPDAFITMVSRGGELPSVRSELLLRELPNLNAKNPALPTDYPRLRAIFVQAARDLRALYGGKSQTLRSPSIEAQLATDITACESGMNQWQHAIGHFIEEMNRVWPSLTLSDQREFRLRYSPFISRFVSSFPLENAKILDMGFRERKVRVTKVDGEIGDLFQTYPGRGFLMQHNFDLVLNCTGLNPYGFWRTKLGTSLREQGAKANPHGGLAVNTASMRLVTDRPDFNCYAIGAPVSGSLLVTNYVRASVIQASIVVSDIEAHFIRRQHCRKAA